jgi:hypothetical protein
VEGVEGVEGKNPPSKFIILYLFFIRSKTGNFFEPKSLDYPPYPPHPPQLKKIYYKIIKILKIVIQITVESSVEGLFSKPSTTLHNPPQPSTLVSDYILT